MESGDVVRMVRSTRRCQEWQGEEFKTVEAVRASEELSIPYRSRLLPMSLVRYASERK